MSSHSTSESTLRVKQPVFHASGKAWRDFQFSRLPKVSRTELLVLESLDWLLPDVRSGGQAIEAMRERLIELTDQKVRLGLEFRHVIPVKDFRRYVASPTFLCTLGALPHKPRALFEIDVGLAHATIGQLLGGAHDAAALRPLTEIEEGVISYVVLEMLKVLSPHMASGLPRLKLEGVCGGVAEAEKLWAEEKHLAVVQLKCVLGAQAGHLRFFVPSSLLAGVKAPIDADARRDMLPGLLESHLGRLGGIQTFWRAEIGHARISMSDVRGLRQGDVVLLDELSARPDLSEGGTAKLRLGSGRQGWLDCDVELDGGRFRASVTGLHVGDPSVVDESERGNVASESMGEGAELVNDIPLHLSVELARVPTTAEEVVSLKVGQVLDLNRVPGEPVDVSVGGKVIGRGELVEVEGHLGVRITELNG